MWLGDRVTPCDNFAGVGGAGAVSGVSLAKDASAAKGDSITKGKRPLPPQLATALGEAKIMADNLKHFKNLNPKPFKSQDKKLAKKRNHFSSSESEYSEMSDSDTSYSLSEENQPLVTAKQSHHKKAKCRMPGCKAVVGDLRCHLHTHVKKEELEEDLHKALAITERVSEVPE